MGLVNLGKNLGGWASGLNWYVLAAKAAIVIAILSAVHFQAIHSCEMKHEKELTKQADTRAASTVQEVTARLPVVAAQTQKAAEQQAVIKQHGDALHEVTTLHAATSNCTLSNDELQQYRELAKATAH